MGQSEIDHHSPPLDLCFRRCSRWFTHITKSSPGCRDPLMCTARTSESLMMRTKRAPKLGEPPPHVEKALGSHDAVDDLTQEVGMAVVTGVFFNHMHQYPTHRRASGTRFIAPERVEIAEGGDHGPGMHTLR